MRHETFSYLPAFDDADVAAQVRHVVESGLVCAIEHTDRPDPYAHYWELWKLPLFGLDDPAAVLAEIAACRAAHGDHHVRLNGYDRMRQGQVVSFLVHRPG